MARDFDLFGNPVRARHGEAGRPEHQVDPRNAAKIMAWALAGMTVAEMAEGLGISAPTFRKHYFQDLRKAKLKAARAIEVQAIEQLQAAAADGNVSAMKELRRIAAEKRIEDLPGEWTKRPTKAAEDEGKKAARRRAAVRPDGDWVELGLPLPGARPH